MAEVYAWCEDPDNNPQPRELVLLRYIDRFGAQSVMGRALSAGEIRSMILAENVVNLYKDRAAASDWFAWARDNEDEAQLLNEAMRLCQTQI